MIILNHKEEPEKESGEAEIELDKDTVSLWQWPLVLSGLLFILSGAFVFYAPIETSLRYVSNVVSGSGGQFGSGIILIVEYFGLAMIISTLLLYRYYKGTVVFPKRFFVRLLIGSVLALIPFAGFIAGVFCSINGVSLIKKTRLFLG